MNECKKVHRLLALRPKDWSAVEQDRVEAHMTDCPNCAALAEQYAEQNRLIRAAPRVRLTPSQRSQLLARIQLERRQHEMHIKLSAILGTAAAIVVLTTLTLGLSVLFQQNGQPAIVAPTGPYPTDGGMPLTTPGPITVATGYFQWPTTQHDISGWTFRDPRNPDHFGLDIAAALGDPIVATDGGVVIFAGWEEGYGNLVIVEHTDEWSSYYAQLDEITVKVGQQVQQGELLGRAGSTGYASGPHLHFELRYQDRPVDPQVYLPSSSPTDEDTLLPALVWPVEGHIALSYSTEHPALDIVTEEGTPVVAAADGVVVVAQWDEDGCGWNVIIDHGNGLRTRYCHLLDYQVKIEDVVTEGQPIGRVGSTGRSTSPHLHFELIQNGERINPLRLLQGSSQMPDPEPLVFAGEIRNDDLYIDSLTGKRIPLTLGEPDYTEPFAPGQLHVPANVHFSLNWQVVAPPSADWVVFVHLTNKVGELVAQSDVPVDWPAQPCAEGEYGPQCTVVTEHEWGFPADFLPSGLYTISVGLYDRVTGERAPVTSPPGATSPVALGQVRVVSDAEITPTPVEPTETHDLPDQWIAFRNQDYDVCLMKPDGRGRHCLPKAEDRYRVASLAWSPDGQTLAYTYYYGSGKAEDGTSCCPQQVMFYDLDSQHVSTLDIPEEIFPLPGGASWFPNGRYLLAGRYDIYVIEISTGQVSNAFVISLRAGIFWSPDGERLIFTSEQVLEEEEKRPVQSGNAFSLAVFEIGQQEPRILCEGTRETDYFPLAWLPDGRVFYERVERESDGRTEQITHWTIHPDDKASEPQPAQDIPFAFDENAQRALLPAEFQNAWSLSLSADEHWLIFTWRDRTTDARVPSDPDGIYLFDLKEDGEPILLAYGDGPAWQPGLTE